MGARVSVMHKSYGNCFWCEEELGKSGEFMGVKLLLSYFDNFFIT